VYKNEICVQIYKKQNNKQFQDSCSEKKFVLSNVLAFSEACKGIVARN